MGVSQISMPMRILLIGAAVFLAAWFTVLKPGGSRGRHSRRSSTAERHAARDDRPTAATTGRRRRPTREHARRRRGRRPPTSLAKLPKGVAGALKARKMLVLGVFADDASNWRPMADDDRYVRNALKQDQPLRRRGLRQERQHLAALRPTAPLVNDLGVNQSPSVVVIDRNLKGTRPHRLRRPHRHQPGDRRRPPRQHRPEHHGRLPAQANDDLRALQAALRALVAARRSAARRRVTPPRTASSAIGRELPRAGCWRRRRPAKWQGLKASGCGRSSATTAATTRHGRVDQERATSTASWSPPWASTANDARQARPPLRRGRRSPTARSTAGRRLKRSWTASASKSTSPRPTGAALCVPGASTATPGARSAAT